MISIVESWHTEYWFAQAGSICNVLVVSNGTDRCFTTR